MVKRLNKSEKADKNHGGKTHNDGTTVYICAIVKVRKDSARTAGVYSESRSLEMLRHP